MRIEKKGSLSLSINAIVVLILAITILGLGLGFIYTLFGGATDRLVSMQAELETEIIEKALQSGELLYFPQVRIDAVAGRPTEVIAAITNHGDEAAFTLSFGCDSLIDGTCPADTVIDTWFRTYDDVTIPNGEARAFPIIVTPQTRGNYMLTISSTANDGREDVIKSFYLNVK